MKKVINGFNVEVTQAYINDECMSSYLCFNKTSEKWVIGTWVNRVEITYNIDGGLPLVLRYDIDALERDFYQIANDTAKYPLISKDDFYNIYVEIAKYFAVQVNFLFPQKLSNYETMSNNGIDIKELPNLDKKKNHLIFLKMANIEYINGNLKVDIIPTDE